MSEFQFYLLPTLGATLGHLPPSLPFSLLHLFLPFFCSSILSLSLSLFFPFIQQLFIKPSFCARHRVRSFESSKHASFRWLWMKKDLSPPLVQNSVDSHECQCMRVHFVQKKTPLPFLLQPMINARLWGKMICPRL